VLNLGKDLERRGYKVATIPVDSKGRLDMQRADELIDEETAIVSLMWANNETGNIYPVERICELAHKRGALFHTDAVQAVGKVPMKLSEMQIDMLSLSGHKPPRAQRRRRALRPQGRALQALPGGRPSGRGRRAGTENVAGIVALGKAAELAQADIADENTRVKALRDKWSPGSWRTPLRPAQRRPGEQAPQHQQHLL
jgi:cysteine desulfurase